MIKRLIGFLFISSVLISCVGNKERKGLKVGTNIGDIAPDLAYSSVTGDTISLYSLRGSVVLIDFWASWCGPCRRENPNVVKTYNRYKDKGFTIMSVSLDKDLGKWKACLLYTSPSPRDVEESRMPSSA